MRQLCYYRDSVVHNNQRIIATLLLGNAETVVMKTRAKGGSVQIKSMSRDWVSFLEFTAPRRFPPEEVTYHLKMLQLYGDLCVGRNTLCIKILTSSDIGMCYEEAFLGLKDKNLEPRFRAAYCDVLLHLFVDVFPQSPQMTAFKRVWYTTKTDKLLGAEASASGLTRSQSKGTAKRIRNAIVGSSTDTIEADAKEGSLLQNISYDLDEGAEVMNQETEFENPTNLQQFLLGFLFDNHNTRMDNTQQQTLQPHFLVRVLVLMRKAFEFGIFKKKEPLMLTRLRAILEIIEERDYAGQPRTLDADHRAYLIATKREVLRMIDRFIDILQTTLFSSFLQRVARDVIEKNTDEFEAKEELAKALMENVEAIGGTEQFSATHEMTRGLVPVLLLQLHHEDPHLSRHALATMERVMLLQSKSGTLLRTLLHVQLLTRSKDKDFHAATLNKSSQLQQLTSASLDSSKLKQAIDIIEELADACEGDGEHDRAVNQRMFANMDLHGDILNVIQRPIEVDKSVGAKGRSQLLCACYKFLRAFVAGVPANQRAIHEQLNLIVSQMLLYADDGDVPHAITACLMEVFRNNVALCSSVTEKQLQPVLVLVLCKIFRLTWLSLSRCSSSTARTPLYSTSFAQ